MHSITINKKWFQRNSVEVIRGGVEALEEILIKKGEIQKFTSSQISQLATEFRKAGLSCNNGKLDFSGVVDSDTNEIEILFKNGSFTISKLPKRFLIDT